MSSQTSQSVILRWGANKKNHFFLVSIILSNCLVSFTGKIPDETKALPLLAPAPSVTGLIPGAGLLPIPTSSPLASVSDILKPKVSGEHFYCTCIAVQWKSSK